MKKTILFIAPLGARNKKAAIFEEIVSQCPDRDYSSVLYITPAAFSQTEARRQFFSYLRTTHKKKVYIPFQSFTIKNLCTNLYETHGKENIISDRIEPLILCEILGEKNIGMHHTVHTIGYARRLSELLGKTRHYILDKELSQIKEDIKSQIFEEKTMKRAVKAIEILEVYEKELKEKGLVDFESAIKNSILLIKEYVSPAILVLDGFFDPTPLELGVIKALIEKTDKAYVLVEENAEFLKFFSATADQPAAENGEVGIEKRIFKPFRSRESIGYYPYPSMEDEVEGIARGVKGHILEGIKPWEIIVSFPVLSKYLPMVKRIFQKHRIPISIAEHDLSKTKPFIALEEMIISIEEDYPRNDFLSFLTSAYFPKIPEVIKEWAVVYSNRAGIIKGKGAWLSIKKILLNSQEEEISETDKGLINEFQREIKVIIGVFEKIKDEKNLSSFVDVVEAALNRFGFFDAIDESLSDSFNGEEVANAINNQFSELRHFPGLFGLDSPGPEACRFYLRHLLEGLKGRDKGGDGVRLLPFEYAAGLEAKVLFFGGMIEGDFPSKPGIDPILPEKVKKAFGMPFLEYYLERQKRYFKRLLNVSVQDPYFFCPTSDGDKIFLPSPFLDWGLSLDPPELNIFTEEEALVREGALKQKDFSNILWDGELPLDKEIKKFLMHRFGHRMFFRVTEIDSYRKCPLRFYIENILKIEIERPPKFEVEARLWGRLAHKTMEYLYKDGDIELEDIDKRLFKGLEFSLEEFPIGDFWSKVAREIFQRLLPMLKEQETNIRMQGFSPYMVEKSLKTTLNSLRLKGKIDRIDIKKFQISNSKFQKDERGDKVVLLDYKTGAIDKESLQLPLYACMWQKENAESIERVGFYSLKDGCVDWYPKRLNMEEFILKALQEAEKLVQGIRKGIFKPIPFRDEECRYCYHSALCKKETQMTTEKTTDNHR